MLSAALLFAACGGGGGSTATVRDFLDSTHDSLCDFQVRCGAFPDKATCLAVTFSNTEQATILADVEAGRVDYDADQAGACLDVIEGLGCDTGSLLDSTLAATCNAVFSGHVAIGATCVNDEQCVDGADCQKASSCTAADTCCAGSCVAAPDTEVAMGGDCSQNRNCVAGTYCSRANTCDARITEEGATCDSFSACAAPLVCNIVATAMGTCYKPVGHDETCDPQVLLGPCADIADYCDATTLKCTSRGKDGDACDANNSDSCVAYATCQVGICKDRPVAGEGCVVDSARACLGDLGCVNDVCTAPPAATACP
jgi:hypothetical protein